MPFTTAMALDALGQMEGEGVLFAKLAMFFVEREKIGLCQESAQAAWCFSGVSIPEAGGYGRQDGGKIGEDIAGEQSQFREAEDAIGSKDELAVQADHLFGGEGDLFHGPTVKIEGEDRERLQVDIGGQHQGVLIERIEEDPDVEGLTLRVDLVVGQDQVLPGVNLNHTSLPGET